MPENTQVSKNRDKYMERLKGRYPDRDFADDEALFGQINDDYDDYDNQLSGYQEREQAFSDLFTQDPRSAAFLTNWRQGGDPVVELVRMFGDDFIEELKDPAKQDQLAQANKEYAERISQEQEYDEQYKANMQETLATVEAVKQETGMTDDDVDDVMTYLVGIMKDGILGKFSRDSILMAYKAINHDRDMEDAQREGLLMGRNSRIEERLRRRGRNDGTPNLESGGSAGTGGRRGSGGIFDLARQAR